MRNSPTYLVLFLLFLELAGEGIAQTPHLNEVFAQVPPVNYSGGTTEVRVWTDAKKAYRIEAQLVKIVDDIVHLWEKLSNEELTHRLNRTLRAIRTRRLKLGIKEAMYCDDAKPWTAADDRVVRLPVTSSEVADRIGRTLNAVKYRRLQLGVRLRAR